ncbi:acyltransferase family protein [Citrobacter freundii]|uniref:acyltransferase family protein n=1 Tax=Citrobacter freundii TaxID=546 RepID=UPI000B419973|nr:acyltransferase [Citrobacter freundii]
MEFTQGSLLFSISIILVAVICAYIIQKTKLIPNINYKSGEYSAISGVRGLAAIFVYVNHAPYMLNTIGAKPSFSSWGWIYGNLGSFGVQIFFCITGFLFFDRIIKNNGEMSWNRFYEARIKRICPLFYTACIAYFIIAFVENKSVSLSASDLQTAVSLMSFGFIESSMKIGEFNLYPINGVIWTLVHEWRFYFALPLIAYAYANKKIGPSVLLIAIIAAITDLYNSPLVCWAYFLTGIITAIIYNKKISYLKSMSSLFSVIAIICLIVTMGAKINQGYNWQRYIISSIFFFSIILSNPFWLRFGPLKILGEISYSVYLLHLPILYVAIKLLNQFTDLNTISFNSYWFFILIVDVFIVLISSISFRFIESRFMNTK